MAAHTKAMRNITMGTESRKEQQAWVNIVNQRISRFKGISISLASHYSFILSASVRHGDVIMLCINQH